MKLAGFSLAEIFDDMAIEFSVRVNLMRASIMMTGFGPPLDVSRQLPELEKVAAAILLVRKLFLEISGQRHAEVLPALLDTV
jgi:hypothetical protein